jgi:hypothetical protein
MPRPMEPEFTTIYIRLKDSSGAHVTEELSVKVVGSLTKNDIIEAVLTPEGHQVPLYYDLHADVHEVNWGASLCVIEFTVDVVNDPWVVSAVTALATTGVEYVFRQRRGALKPLPSNAAASKAKSYLALERFEDARALQVIGVTRNRKEGLVAVELASSTMQYTVEVKRYRSDSTYGFFISGERSI